MDKSGTFFLAISSINVTWMLIVYLYMNKEEVPNNMKRLRAGRKQIKRFGRMNAFSKTTFFELHAFLLTYLYRSWVL